MEGSGRSSSKLKCLEGLVLKVHLPTTGPSPISMGPVCIYRSEMTPEEVATTTDLIWLHNREKTAEIRAGKVFGVSTYT